MRYFMGDDAEDAAPRVARAGGWIEFAIALSISTSPYPNLQATIQSPAATLP
jgi:hypothetical protein